MDQRELSQAYKDTFTGPQAETVLVDLSSFCAFTGTTVPRDEHDRPIIPIDTSTVMMMEGRRQVFLWVKNLLSLDDQQLVEMQQAAHARKREMMTRRPLHEREWA